jgi:hypothetical protein
LVGAAVARMPLASDIRFTDTTIRHMGTHIHETGIYGTLHSFIMHPWAAIPTLGGGAGPRDLNIILEMVDSDRWGLGLAWMGGDGKGKARI